ncbi:conserved hypothetical protein [Afipia carboxidovorans OM5]|uniref:Uncharacterized protein n=1 Tax=Afipia carboxidovorans (strain ATCC 49405 / DSM 1227 / KCTC 32145 / OM5) TaxID=504832 RepID=B6JFW3_AFIC5|nr:hypothetical protein [Afipia carboxidovorans]ACI92923.1 conserved hypothetical protein [Afipia carboxidovorans OM5]AEI03339.1 hypothetical protein OCA4_c22130 [Afipia carboxidovorans OM4]AEI06916.1 hypothetical protein OCA5_c22140 [Afipia carboxidovorans OM5]
MSVSDLKASLAEATPPANLSQPLMALWWVAKGDWEQAHALAQKTPTADGAWVHAHIHRAEGDLDNAGYWYGRAGKPASSEALETEWDQIASVLLGKQD